jgi:hypothetical protein
MAQLAVQSRQQTVSATARIGNTFIDGSHVELAVDDEVTDRQLVWARAGTSRDVQFSVKLSQPGRHRIRVGNQTASVLVKSGEPKVRAAQSPRR